MKPSPSSTPSSRVVLTAALAALVLVPLAGCASGGGDDELAVDDASAEDDGKSDGAGTYTYYLVEHDDRRCASPFCGGYFYRLANARTTRCLDGSRQDRCYAASADLTPTGLDDTGLARLDAGQGIQLMRATVRRRDWGGGVGVHGELRVTEAWAGQWPVEHDGVLVRVEPSGIECITTPCPSLQERKLNSSARAVLAELGWAEAGASADEAAAAMNALPIIIAGDRYRVGGQKARTVTQLWLRAENEQCAIIDCAAPPEGCHYEGMQFTPCDQQTCGTLVCTDPSPF